MRLALALPLVLLLAAAVSAPVAAQQARPSHSNSTQSKAKQPPPAQPTPAAEPVSEAPKLTPEEERLRQRILLQERFNKGWNIQAEDERSRRARCKREAKQRYSAMHPIKRRKYIKNCNAEAKAAVRPR
jgi:hypothetical protein